MPTIAGRRLQAMLAAFVLALGAGQAQAQYPEKAIRLIVPYPPGGLTDASARAVAQSLSERIKQPVVIENVAGGGGNIGADKAAKSPADGYTLYVGNNATVGIRDLHRATVSDIGNTCELAKAAPAPRASAGH